MRRYGLLGLAAVTLGYLLGALTFSLAQSVTIHDSVGISESVSGVPSSVTRMHGVLTLQVHAPTGELLSEQVMPNAWPAAGEAYLVDVWRGLQPFSNARYHGLGSSSTPFAESQTGCVSELTTAYQTDNVRATGTLAVGATPSVFKSVGLNVIDQPGVTIREFCLMTNANVGQGTVIARALLTPFAVPVGATITTTYILTFE
jgi:hypothetical protein